jgi:hypothetical protein
MISIDLEPGNDTYLQLLQAALKMSNQFSLVWRDQLEFSHAAHSIAKDLDPFLQKEVRTDTWPGTNLLGHYAVVRFYQYTINSYAILAKVSGLYSWQAPDFPEDLAFYRLNGRCWFGSISHESDAFLDVDEQELAFLCNQIPNLKVKSEQ